MLITTCIITGFLFLLIFIFTGPSHDNKKEKEEKKEKNDLLSDSNKAREMTDECVKDTNTFETNYLREYISRLLLENVKMGNYDVFVDEKRVFHRKTNHVASVRVQKELNDAGYETTYDHEKGIMHIYWGRIPKNSSAEVEFKFTTSGMKKNPEEPKEDVEETKD